jgi:hypothetical protein
MALLRRGKEFGNPKATGNPVCVLTIEIRSAYRVPTLGDLTKGGESCTASNRLADAVKRVNIDIWRHCEVPKISSLKSI